MRLTRADVLALLIVLGAAITGVVVWNHGTVDLGMTLRVVDAVEYLGPEAGLTGDVVIVDDVTPGGNADRNGFYPGGLIIDLTTTDGSEVERGEPIEGIDYGATVEGWNGEVVPGASDDFRLPAEAVDSTVIAAAASGEVYVPDGVAFIYTAVDRLLLEYELNQSLWIAALALLLGAIVWRLLAHGLAGPFGRRHSLVVGAAVAVPGLIYPAVQVGTPAGIAAGALVPAAVALALGLAISRHHPDPQWANTARAAAVVAAGMAAVIVLRAITNPALSTNDAGTTLLMIAAIGVVPAAIAGLGTRRTARERASLLSLGLVPAAAAILNAQRYAEPIVPVILVALLLGWYMLPIERAIALVGGGLARVRSTAPASPAPGAAPAVTTPVHEPIVTAALRDRLTLALLGLITLMTILRPDIGSFSVLGAILAAAVGLAVRNGFLGSQWADAAVPLAASVGVPVMLASWWGWSGDGTSGWYVLAIGLVGMSVAHVLAGRHSDARWRPRLLLWAGGLAGISVLLWLVDGGYSALPWLGAAAVPLVPGLPVAFADDPDEPRAISTRLETLVVALTLFVSALVLTPLAWVPLVAWFIAIVVWRRFTLAPLIGLAQRTQLQRDLAVAAAETERARLAADLHDDALQQLTMLVRTLDEGGHTAEADEAREVATKLRSVVGDLRLPILDDLGAGAALEWLVERVEPLAGGPVKLERTDETRRPPANVELAVFRVAQEALTNAIKHGKPPIAVHYDVRADGRVTLAVDDAGSGIGPEAAEEAPRAGHFGLANMQQRAEQIGALLDVRRWPAGGTRVALEWRPQG